MRSTSKTPETVSFVYRLLYEEGLFLGSTSGINVGGRRSRRRSSWALATPSSRFFAMAGPSTSRGCSTASGW